ncbi:hypothetical protein [Agrobacterium vaccinii]|uniref:hypothetical protein n=1 Tax=Agrobacterium vaccinii TaxID=2735528 RepID=UPI001E358793|nr:hypothetical protein [Agrobacterium vaccinii]UHS59315.1 hypothetical protein HRS00_21105 [Agrobacterium vaccinii]
MRKITSSLFVTACLALPFQAHSLDVSVGGVSASVGGNDRGGVSASASVGGSGGINAGAGVGGRSGGGLGADVNASVGGRSGVNANTSASVGGKSGINADVNASAGKVNANAKVGVGTTTGVGVNVGVGIGTPGVPGGPISPGTTPPGAVRDAIISYNNMSRTQQVRLAKRCVDILGGGYDAALTQLCRMIHTASR